MLGLLATPLHAGLALPAPMRPSKTTAVPVLTGGDTANVLFGKIQRAATLPGSRLSPNPLAAVDSQGALRKVLWGQFMMSSVPSGDVVPLDDLPRTRRVEESLLFVDGTQSEAGSSLGLPNPFASLFGPKSTPRPAAGFDTELLRLAEARGAAHVYVLLDGDAQLQSCIDALAPLAVCATLIAPEQGVALQTTPGWVCGQLQDHEGEVQAPLAVRNGLEAAAEPAEEGAPPPPPPRLLPPPEGAPAGATLPREDFAELVLQIALRCARTAAEGAPRLRVLRVAPAAGGQLTERAVVNYDAVIGGPKTRKRLGTAQSADWSAVLAPFQVVRRSDPNDWRVLIDAVALPAELPGMAALADMAAKAEAKAAE